MDSRGPVTFLTLPWELRRQILQELLKRDEPLSKVSRVVEIYHTNRMRQNDVYYWRFELGQPMGLQPQILAVCRQLFEEGSMVLYANTVVISFAPCAFDVLGNWKTEEVVQRGVNGRSVPLLGRFRNIEFRVYMDFTNLRLQSQVNTVLEMCRELVASGCHSWDHIKVVIRDGSDGARFTRPVAEWAKKFVGFEHLNCRTFTLAGDVPEGVSTVLDILRLADSQRPNPPPPNPPGNAGLLYVM